MIVSPLEIMAAVIFGTGVAGGALLWTVKHWSTIRALTVKHRHDVNLEHVKAEEQRATNAYQEQVKDQHQRRREFSEQQRTAMDELTKMVYRARESTSIATCRPGYHI